MKKKVGGAMIVKEAGGQVLDTTGKGIFNTFFNENIDFK